MRTPLIALLLLAVVGCADVPILGPPTKAPALDRVTVVIPADAAPGLVTAATDLSQAVDEITGTAPPVVRGLAASRTSIVVRVIRDETLGPQTYRITRRGFDEVRAGLEIAGSDDVAAMYGLYDLIGEMGVRYHHPEESFFPEDREAVLPWEFDGEPQAPQFALRGFHEHTQHPIPMSDFYLRPEPEFRPYVSNYLRWLARNRQNVASMHMLNSVDLDAWEPYISDVVEEAHAYGINIGMVVSFVDEQQNNFRLITEPENEEAQITAAVQRFAAMGFDFLTHQIGSSEFTKPPDESVIRWLNHAAEIGRELDIRTFTWIHISCSLRDDDGSIFWHLPGQTNPDVGVWVHTVMFHDLNHPAPVYDCENFRHQKEFLEREEGERAIVYYPESAWWLGFDNNMPLALPITLWTRSYDINQELEGHDVEGHVTFTSGREWAYWQYDHFLTQSTWETGLDWHEYLDWIEPMYGENGEAAVLAVESFAEQQVRDFFETNPLIYFYLAGELRQDELGAQAGILARRPKIPYRDVVRYDDETYEAWLENDYQMLENMLTVYSSYTDRLPAPNVPDADSALTDKLYFELYSVLDLFVKRIAHALALYGAVQVVREWTIAKTGGATNEEPLHDELLAEANELLDEARAISEYAEDTIHAVEALYRYPAEILYEPKPETPTSYPIGYLEETHTAHFWTRRDDQLADLIDQVFFERPDEWENEPAELYYAEGENVELLEPSNPFAGDVITGFIPRMLYGMDGDTLVVGQDYNENFIPDRGTELSMPIDRNATPQLATSDVYTFVVRNSTGELVGDGLSVFDPVFELEFDGDTLVSSQLHGQVAKTNLIGLITEVGGIEADGAERLLKTIFGVPTEEELPTLLPFRFELTFTAQ